ncbi:HdeD family acid-resistance protein [Actinoplanes aureus]|uniref:DUF308 domain-containing protein n=1 Tax=Actinoplanes aureus TaxID=2792083 RepID=A0A931G3N9_9ACTN|nr:DUF308 domain-containing protein [Actinoplanes aureus]MBG0567181.1 DUF308 domain-containing protein [Actinoplanes aureus]
MARTWHWVGLVAGLLTLALGIVAFVWPEATLRVVGFLFGLNLLVVGVARTVVLLFSSGYPTLNRVVGIVFGVFVAIVGILCLRNVAGSVALLLLIVAIGWILDGIAEIVLAIGSGESGRGWRLAFGAGAIVAAIALLVWPGIGLTAFLFIGATTLCFLGICLIFVAVAGLRSRA